MIEIIGKFNIAKCYAETIGDAAVAQISAICDEPVFQNTKIRIMPDVHAGKGCTIGTTMTITDKIVPAMVGVDIGCGMYAVGLGSTQIDLAQFDALAHAVPSGHDIWETPYEPFDLTELKCYSSLKRYTRLACSLGTLGGGNHFIELNEDADGDKYLVIHSGSRNLGVQVAEYYQNLAIDLRCGKEEYLDERKRVITQYKSEGRQKEIAGKLSELKMKWENRVPDLLPELCYLTDRYMADYMHDIRICQRFARRNREIIAAFLLDHMRIKAVFSFHTIHNYIDADEMILRKGAVSAKCGETLLIPINMRDGSLICIGKGNEDWNCSAPHGAGRLLSRSDAIKRLTMEEYQMQMEGIYSTCIAPETLDESPMAYKNIEEIMRNIVPTADIVRHIRPIYNFKATD